MQQLNYLRGKVIGVLGLARTGINTYITLKQSNVDVIAWDDNIKSRNELIKIASTQIAQKKILLDIVNSDDIKWQKIDIMLISPGIPTNYPKPHKLVEIAKKYNIKIICDIELLYKANPFVNFVAITGTNGKSTTTSLIGHIMTQGKVQNQIGGNIGNAVMTLPKLRVGGVYVLELSSFQLELIDEFRSEISILLNITPDHLDRYKDMQAYIDAKLKIFENQNQNDVAIIGVDDEICHDIYEKVKASRKHKKVIPISVKKELKYGVYVQDDNLFYNVDEVQFSFKIPRNNALRGQHNQQNILAAVATAIHFKISIEDIIKALTDFMGLKHRMEYLGEKENVKYINDSKATNIDSCIPALSTYDNILWIAGGYIKGEEELEKIMPFLHKIRKAFLIGKSANSLAQFLSGKLEYSLCKTLDNALYEAKKYSKKNDVILFSPAYASLDQFKSFEHRGEVFRELYIKI